MVPVCSVLPRPHGRSPLHLTFSCNNFPKPAEVPFDTSKSFHVFEPVYASGLTSSQCNFDPYHHSHNLFRTRSCHHKPQPHWYSLHLAAPPRQRQPGVTLLAHLRLRCLCLSLWREVAPSWCGLGMRCSDGYHGTTRTCEHDWRCTESHNHRGSFTMCNTTQRHSLHVNTVCRSRPVGGGWHLAEPLRLLRFRRHSSLLAYLPQVPRLVVVNQTPLPRWMRRRSLTHCPLACWFFECLLQFRSASTLRIPANRTEFHGRSSSNCENVGFEAWNCLCFANSSTANS